jgi:hypothetical protein
MKCLAAHVDFDVLAVTQVTAGAKNNNNEKILLDQRVTNKSG